MGFWDRLNEIGDIIGGLAREFNEFAAERFKKQCREMSNKELYELYERTSEDDPTYDIIVEEIYRRKIGEI